MTVSALCKSSCPWRRQTCGVGCDKVITVHGKISVSGAYLHYGTTTVMITTLVWHNPVIWKLLLLLIGDLRNFLVITLLIRTIIRPPSQSIAVRTICYSRPQTTALGNNWNVSKLNVLFFFFAEEYCGSSSAVRPVSTQSDFFFFYNDYFCASLAEFLLFINALSRQRFAPLKRSLHLIIRRISTFNENETVFFLLSISSLAFVF